MLDPVLYHYDGIGVTNVTDAAGLPQWSYSYDAFGNSRSSTKVNPLAPDNPMRYTGQYLDPTGLYHLRARQYDPGLGRFTATDPVTPPAHFPSESPYAYVGNRPTFDTDPSGRTPLRRFCLIKLAIDLGQCAFDVFRDGLPTTKVEQASAAVQFSSCAKSAYVAYRICRVLDDDDDDERYVLPVDELPGTGVKPTPSLDGFEIYVPKPPPTLIVPIGLSVNSCSSPVLGVLA